MIREGDAESSLSYLSQNYRKLLVVTNYTDGTLGSAGRLQHETNSRVSADRQYLAVQTQGKNILTYSHYLTERAKSYNKTRQDFVGSAQTRLKRLPVDKGLLRECESVQAQIQALVRCDVRGH